MPTGWTSADPTTIRRQTKNFQTWRKCSSKLMWKARLSELEFDERELSGVLDAIDSAWITAGPRTQAFETRFAELVGTGEAIAVSNGTAALFLALKALGIGPG